MASEQKLKGAMQIAPPSGPSPSLPEHLRADLVNYRDAILSCQHLRDALLIPVPPQWFLLQERVVWLASLQLPRG